MAYFVRDKLELKILILLIMSRVVEPIKFDELFDLAYCDDGVNYFDFVEAVQELVDTEHLLLASQQYSITEKGLRNFRLCEDSVSASLRAKALKAVGELNDRLLRDSMIRTSIFPQRDGSFTTRLSFAGDMGNIMTLELMAASEEQATLLAERFEANAEVICREIVGAILRPRPDLEK